MFKRTFDLISASLALLIFAPLMLLLVVFIRMKMGSPVIFTQQRPGLFAKPFCVYKFRTMTEKKDDDGNLLPDKDRMTVFGYFLRATSLDELPQLFNVIKGDLSLVGPRPLLMEYVPLYNAQQARRHEVRPGITGWAQVNGRNEISWEDKFKLDVWYVDNQSFWLDVKIILLTIKKVFFKDGINADGDVTMPKFTGTKSQ